MCVCCTVCTQEWTHTHTHSLTHTLECFSKGCLCKGSWILKLAAYFTFMNAGNGPTADMITARSRQERALTFSYGSHYPFSTSLSLSVYLYLLFEPPPVTFSFSLVISPLGFFLLRFSHAVCVYECLLAQAACMYIRGLLWIALFRHKDQKWCAQTHTHTHTHTHTQTYVQWNGLING